MNILVVGSGGQLGSELKELAAGSERQNYCFRNHAELDITDHEQLLGVCRAHSIAVIVNCAAYTSVDRSESDVEAAFLVNSEGPAVLASCARMVDALLIHISTDYVFDGKSSIPYREIDPANPLGIYGKSKWEGEERVRKIAPSYIIIRTSWLYSVYGNNFVKTMVRRGAGTSRLKVVFDQVGAPTHAADLAQAIISIIERYDSDCHYGETYHYANEGVCSWYDLALAVMELSGLSCNVLPVETSQYPLQAPRPHYSVMNKSAIERDWGLEIPHWRASLAVMLQKLKGREACLTGACVDNEVETENRQLSHA